MPMVPFYTLDKKLAFDEMRTVIIPADMPLPEGPYGFLEFYCNERNCDCRRVIFHVVRPDTGTTVWATINYGWDSPEFYAKFMRDADWADEAASSTLDPLGPQTDRSEWLLDLFRTCLQSDEAYVARLKRHYELFKQAIVDGRVPSETSEVAIEPPTRRRWKRMRRRSR